MIDYTAWGERELIERLEKLDALIPSVQETVDWYDGEEEHDNHFIFEYKQAAHSVLEDVLIALKGIGTSKKQDDI